MKNLLFILLSVTLLAACQSSSDELVSPDASSKIVQRSTRAFHANLSAAIDPNSAPTACSNTGGQLAVLDYFISGNATHLGLLNTNLSTLHHDDCDLNGETLDLSTSVSGQLVGANGDKITYTGEDVINVFNFLTNSGPNGPITGTWTITGGTGRFVGASGSFTISGLVNFTTLGFNVVADGTITY
jgi:putative hemolysin